MKSKRLSTLVFLSLLTSLLVFIQAPNSFALSQGSTTDGDGLGGAVVVAATSTPLNNAISGASSSPITVSVVNRSGPR